jgi:hypothetical protein
VACHAELIPPATSYVPEFSPLEMGGLRTALRRRWKRYTAIRQAERSRPVAPFRSRRTPPYSSDAVTQRLDELFVALAGETEITKALCS